MLKVVIIGGVAAGMSSAAKLKRNMKDAVDIAVYEKGGMVSYGACGIPYYVAGAIRDADSLIERTPEQFAAAGIGVYLHHEVTGVDLEGKSVAGRNLATGETFTREYDKLIVASGARTRTFPPLDGEYDNLHIVRDVADGVRLRRALEGGDVRRVVIVGAGFIGLEMAEACVRQGKEVLLVELADRVLSAVDPEITDILAAELAGNGVAVRTGARVTGLSRAGARIVSATVESAAGTEEAPADLVINCAGITPNTEFIGVEKAPNGAILVNERMETSAPDVYAGGDCSVMISFVSGERQYAPLGTNANKQGRIIAEALAGKAIPRLRLLGSAALRLFGVDAAMTGLSERDARRLTPDCGTNVITGNSQASYCDPGKMTVKLVYDRATRRLLGAQAAGRGEVVARVNYYAVAIASGMTVDEFGFVDLGYSPPFSGVWDVSLIAANTAK